MSMAKRLLGKSRTCPLLAATSKSGPRYLLIVRALAGDSTMTRDFFFFRAATLGSSLGSSAVRPPGPTGGPKKSQLFWTASSLQSVFWVASSNHPYYTVFGAV